MMHSETSLPESPGKGLRIALGAVAGALLAVFGYVPLVWWIQDVFDVPQPTIHPNGLPLSVDPPAVGYWVSWIAPGCAVLVCALGTAGWRTARPFTLALASTFLPVAALLAWFVISMDLYFTAD